MKQKYILEKLSTALFYASILIFLIAFNFQDSKSGGWYLQYIPVGNQINDVTFTDSLTGFIATAVSSNMSYILKTTNAGNNWFIKKTNVYPFAKIVFLDKNIGYCSSWDTLFKTTNAGENWNPIPITAGFWIDDFSVLNQDTIWAVDGNGLVGGLYRTTNGGQSWINQFYQYNNNPDKIYMYNKNFGFIARGTISSTSYVERTSDGGFNWTNVTANFNDTSFTDIHFIDTLTGYIAGSLRKTTNGGFNWVNLNLPMLNYSNRIFSFSFINTDTIWGTGGIYSFPNADRGIVYRTTNGGLNWGYQIPDTSFGIYGFWYIDFNNNLTGWVYSPATKGIHTIIGGDSILFTNIKEQTTNITSDFTLFQNYPNPFNQMTNVKVQMLKQGFAEIKIFDISGRLIKILVKQNLFAGEHNFKFNGSDLTSGVYFYSLFLDGNRVDTKKMILLK
jgi:photosystem II stability/assembly factor-like uncharacterized protein